MNINRAIVQRARAFIVPKTQRQRQRQSNIKDATCLVTRYWLDVVHVPHAVVGYLWNINVSRGDIVMARSVIDHRLVCVVNKFKNCLCTQIHARASQPHRKEFEEFLYTEASLSICGQRCTQQKRRSRSSTNTWTMQNYVHSTRCSLYRKPCIYSFLTKSLRSKRYQITALPKLSFNLHT